MNEVNILQWLDTRPWILDPWRLTLDRLLHNSCPSKTSTLVLLFLSFRMLWYNCDQTLKQIKPIHKRAMKAIGWMPSDANLKMPQKAWIINDCPMGMAEGMNTINVGGQWVIQSVSGNQPSDGKSLRVSTGQAHTLHSGNGQSRLCRI